jgi:hypothetical protein
MKDPVFGVIGCTPIRGSVSAPIDTRPAARLLGIDFHEVAANAAKLLRERKPEEK